MLAKLRARQPLVARVQLLEGSIRRRAGWIVGLVLVAQLLFGLLYSAYLGAALRYPDEREYYLLAQHLSAGQGYTLDGMHPTAARPPGYPLLLALMLRLHGSVASLRMLNFVALALATYLLYRLIRAQSTPIAAAIGALLVCAYPVLLYTAGTLYPQTIAACCLLAAVSIAHRQATAAETTLGRAIGRAILLGLLCGVLVLLVPALAPICALLLLWLGWWQRRQLAGVAVAALVAALTITPWTIRNAQKFDQVVFVSSNAGLNLLIGNSEYTTPNAGVTVDITKYDAVAGGMDEISRDAYYRRAALAYIQQNPGRSLALYAGKLLNYFNYRNQLRTASEAVSWRELVMLISYSALLTVVLLRLALFRRYPLTRLEALIMLLYIANALVTAVFFTRLRFRLPFDMLLLVVVALFLGRIFRAARSSERLFRSQDTQPSRI